MTNDDIPTFVKNFVQGIRHTQGMTHSGIVLAAAAILDSQLEVALKRTMKPLTKALSKRLFESPDGPLSNFANKIVMARALDVVTVEIYDELQKIRRMRNAFAHSFKILSFESEEIAPIFLSLKKPRVTKAQPSAVFMSCVSVIYDALKLDPAGMDPRSEKGQNRPSATAADLAELE